MSARLKLRSLLLLALLAFLLLTVGVYTAIAYHVRKHDLIQDANINLLTAGHFARTVAGPGYHDRIVDKASVPPEEFARIVATYDELCLKSGLQYLWSLMELDGRIVFTTATHSVLTNKNSACAGFLDVHTNPETYRHAFATMQPEFATFHDQWGAGRMVLLPAWDRQQRKYLFAASIQMESLDAILRRTLAESLLVGLTVAAGFSLLAWLLVRLFTRPLMRLTAAIERMGKGELDVPMAVGQVLELNVLADAFLAMRQTVRQQMGTLRESEERYRNLVENLGIGVTLLSPQLEVLARNRQMREWCPQVEVEGRPLCYRLFNDPPGEAPCSYCPVVQTLQDGAVHEAITESSRGGRIVNYRIVSSPLKDETGQVRAVIEMVEDITARKQLEEGLRASEQRFRELVEFAFDAIAVLRADGTILYASPAVERINGYPREEFLGGSAFAIFHPDELPHVQQEFQKILQQPDAVLHLNCRIQHRDGTWRWIEAHALNQLANPAIGGIVVNYRDITARKQAEDQLRQSQSALNAIMESTQDIVFLLDARDGRLRHFNSAFAREVERSYGVRPQIGMTAQDILPAERLPRWAVLFQRVLTTCETFSTEYQREDDQKYFDVSFNTIRSESQLTGISVFIRDITERKRAEVALRSSEAKLRVLFKILPVGISLLDEHQKIVSMNPALGRILGLSEADMQGGGYQRRQYLRTDGTPMPAEEIPSARALRENREIHNAEVGVALEDGRTIWMAVSAAPLPGVGVAVATRDITERKLDQEALRASQVQLAAVLESTQDIIWSVDAQTYAVLEFNSAFAAFIQRTFGVTLRKMMTAREILPADRFEFWEQRLRQAVAQGVHTMEYQLPHDASQLEVTFNPIREAGRVVAISIFGRDVTARKRAEAALRESEANFRAFFETMTDMIIVGTPAGQVLFTNAAVTKTLGYTADDLQGMHLLDLHPADKRQEAEAIFAAMFKGERDSCPLPLARRDGTLVPVETRAWFGRWNGMDCIFGLSKNLTAEQEAQQRFERLFRNNPAPMALSSLPDRRFTDVNDVYLKLLGYAKEDLIGHTTAELGLIPDEAQQAVIAHQLLAAGRIAGFDVQVRRKDGVLLDGLFSGEVITNQGRQYFLSVMVDITASKRAEQALRKSQAQLAAVLESTTDLIWSVDAQTFDLLEFNEAFVAHNQRQFGVTIQRNGKMREIMPSEHCDFWAALLQRARDHGPFTQEYHPPSLDTQWELTLNPIREENLVVAVSIFARDITARKQAEAALAASEERLRSFLSNSAVVGWLKDEAGRYVFFSENFLHRFQVRREDRIGKTDFELWPRPIAEEFRRNDQAVLASGQPIEAIEEAPNADGSTSWWLNSKFAFQDAAGHRYVGGLGVDITVRKQAELALQESEAVLRSFFDSPGIHRAVVEIVGEDILYVSVNKPVADLLGYSVTDLQGQSSKQIGVPTDYVKQFIEHFEESRRTGQPVSFEYERSFADGVRAFIHTVNCLGPGQQGRLRYAFTSLDITARRQAELALRASEAKFTRLALHIENVLYSMDATTREFRYLSPAFEKMFGYTPEDIQALGGRRAFLAAVIEGGLFQAQDNNVANLQQEPAFNSFRTEAWWRCKDGTRRYVRDHWMPVYEQGRLISTEGVLTDITREKTAEDELKENAAQLKEAQQLAKLGSWTWDVATDVVVWSDELYAITGLDRSQPPPLVAQHGQLFPPEAWPRVQAVFQHAAQSGEEFVMESEFLRRDGTRGHLIAHGLGTRDAVGRVIRLHGTVQDVTERKRLEQQLLEISEREQRRIGQDLHDSVGQQLAAMRFQSSTLLQKLAGRKKVSLTEVERLDGLLEETLRQVRNLSRGLHPVSLDSQGLMQGLRELARQSLTLFGVPCALECAGVVEVSDQRAALNLYRIAQEAVRNAAIHGAPRQILIRLTRADGLVSLAIKDDGHGLPPDVKATRGLGMEIMRYRAASIGATCDIRSQPGAGVAILCQWCTTA